MIKNILWDSLAKSTLFSMPFIFIASYLWINATEWENVPAWEIYWLGDQIFKLGLPLTGLILYFTIMTGKYINTEEYYWIALLTSLLFVIQWTIWIYALKRICGRRRE